MAKGGARCWKSTGRPLLPRMCAAQTRTDGRRLAMTFLASAFGLVRKP